MLEAGIDPAAYGYPQRQYIQPVENATLKPNDDKGDWDIWEEINLALLHQQGRIAQLEGHLTYLRKAFQQHLSYKGKRKFDKF